MSHLSEDILRRYIDEPDALLSYEKEHLLACNACRAKLERVRENAAFAGAALARTAGVDVDGAYARVTGGGVAPSSIAKFHDRRLPQINSWSVAAAAAIAVFLLIAYTPLRGYAGSLLAIFEPQQFTPIGISSADVENMRALPELKKLGTMRMDHRKPGFVGYDDVSKASRAVGFSIFRPHYLPAALPAQDHLYHVAPMNTATFAFKKSAKNLPPNLAGATITVSVGPVSFQTIGERTWFAKTYRKGSHKQYPRAGGPGFRDIPSDFLVITQSPAMRVYSNGAMVAQIEAYLLGLPGLPESARKQLQAIADPSTTLPVPFNIDKSFAKQTVIHGTNGILIGDNTGVGALAMWQQNGTIFCVAGPYAASEIIQVANSLTQ